MKDSQTQRHTLLSQRFPTAADSDAEPFSKAPLPRAFPSADILQGLVPEPLLTITPEKSLRGRQVGKWETTSAGDADGQRKGRQRVRFAPDTRMSPSAESCSAETGKSGGVSGGGSSVSGHVGKASCEDEDSMPRSFTTISHKLYQPGRYTDHDEGKNSTSVFSSLSKSSSSSSPAKKFVVEIHGSKTAHGPVDHSVKNITSHYSDRQHSSKPITAHIIRHNPASVFSGSDDEACATELKEVFEGSSRVTRSPHTPPHTPSPSPSLRHSSPCRSLTSSPARRSPSPSKSPSLSCSSPCPEGRRSAEVMEVFTPDLSTLSAPVVQVIREAPYQPKRGQYIFPFADGLEDQQGYDPGAENALARPEFNSTLKISQELKSVKGKQPDTWEAVSQKLKTCGRKRTQIQEKASSHVNIQRGSGLYRDLVEVDIPLEDLCHSVENDIRLRAPSPTPPPAKVPIGKEPDLMEFFTPDLQPELPDLTLTGIRPIADSLTTADPMLAFDLYRHNRAWNGLTDS